MRAGGRERALARVRSAGLVPTAHTNFVPPASIAPYSAMSLASARHLDHEQEHQDGEHQERDQGHAHAARTDRTRHAGLRGLGERNQPAGVAGRLVADGRRFRSRRKGRSCSARLRRRLIGGARESSEATEGTGPAGGSEPSKQTRAKVRHLAARRLARAEPVRSARPAAGAAFAARTCARIRAPPSGSAQSRFAPRGPTFRRRSASARPWFGLPHARRRSWPIASPRTRGLRGACAEHAAGAAQRAERAQSTRASAAGIDCGMAATTDSSRRGNA